jgi:hypothetical protein
VVTVGKLVKSAVIMLAVGGVVANLGSSSAYAWESSRANSSSVAGGALNVSFRDTWAGTGQVTWTIDTSTSKANWAFTGPVVGERQMTLRDEFCFSKYGIDSVSVGGGGISPGGITGQKDCGTRTGTSPVNNPTVGNNGQVIGRGNVYGRWIWVSHRAQAQLRLGTNNYFVEAYRKAGPLGGDIIG